jgi:hypothetical protein
MAVISDRPFLVRPESCVSVYTPRTKRAAPESTQRCHGDRVRECWTYNPGAIGVDKQQVLLQVTTDAASVARVVEVAGND